MALANPIATVAVSLAVSIQYTNVTDTPTHTVRQYTARLCIASRDNNRPTLGLSQWEGESEITQPTSG